MTTSTENSKDSRRQLSTRYLSVGVALAFLLLSLFNQYATGARDAAFVAYPDEPSHFVGSVMVRDYLASGLSSNPYKFAQNYYDHYPYFAIGYWPPMFYLLAGFWLLIFGVGKFQALLLSAGAAAGMAWILFSMVRSRAGAVAGCCAGLLFLCLREVQIWTSAVMVDLMVGFFCLAAAVRMVKYLDQPDFRNAILCGLCCACATLTKYSGAHTAVMPLATCIELGRFSVLRKLSFLVLYAVIVAMVAPWVLWTSKLSEVGFPHQDISIISRIGPFMRGPFLLFPQPLAALIIVGLVALLLMPKEWQPDLVVLALLYAGCVALLIITPMFAEPRYFLVATASLLALSFAGWAAVFERLTARGVVGTWVVPVFAVALVIFTVPSYLKGHPRLPENLIRRTVKTIVDNPAWDGKRILVAPDLEGPVIAEFAIQDRHRPGYTLLRPGKLFADRDWNTSHYKSHFQSLAEMETYLRENPVDLIVWHKQTPQDLLTHERLMKEMLIADGPHWRRISSIDSTDGNQSWEVYEFVSRP